MRWQFWILGGFYLFAAIRVIAAVGKPRKPKGPVTEDEAVRSVMACVILIGLLIWGATS